MTLANCQRLLKHFNELADGTIKKPFGHKDWADVVSNAKLRAAEMEKRIAWRTSDGFKVKHNIPIVKPKEVKKSGSGSNGK